MTILKHSILLSIISISLHAFSQLFLEKLIEWPESAEIKPFIIISLMIVFIISAYYLIRSWNGKFRAKYLSYVIKIFIAQILTILSLTFIDTPNFDFADFLFKSFVFALIIPMSLLTILFIIDGRLKDATLPSDLP